MSDPADSYWMEQAQALAALADGETSPNPRVGCVLVRDGQGVGWGFHRRAGQAHAEALAVAQAGDRARGATAFVNLEPCAHVGQTPPCADLLVAAGIARVVAAVRDPDPRVDGKGFRRLREAGVQVDVGLGAAAAERLNAPFLSRQRSGRPLVSLKAAVSLDGLLAAREGHSRWITGEAARRFAHRLRQQHDAVLVGAGTVRADDPLLTVRLPGAAAPRLRVVLSESLDLDPGLRLFQPSGDAPTRVYTTRGAAGPIGAATVVRVPSRNGEIDLAAVLADLLCYGVQSLLVEGGARTFAGFLRQGLADRGFVFVSDKLLGAEGATPLLALPTASDPAAGWRLSDARRIALGSDLLIAGALRSLVAPDGA